MRRLIAFLVLVAAFTAPFWWLMIVHRKAPATSEIGYGLMWAPAAAALIAGRGRDLGWRWPEHRWLAFGWLAPVAYALAVYIPAWIAGLADVGVADARAYFGFTDLATAPMFVFATAWTLTISTLANAAYALGEEIGWRGFLSPLLVERYGLVGGGLASGFLWAAWHYPLMFAAPAGWSWRELACFTIVVTANGVTLAWLRLRSRSVWPAALFHASHNAFLAYLDTLSTGGDDLRGETGYGLAISCTVLAVCCAPWRADAPRRP